MAKRIEVDDLTEEQIERVLNSKGFQKMLGYTRLEDGIVVLREENQVFDSLVENIRKKHSQVRSEDSVREFFDLFIEEVESFTEPLTQEGEEDMTADDVEEVYIGDEIEVSLTNMA